MSGKALQDLINSLSKSEKRHVQLFLKRNKPGSNLLKLYNELSSSARKKDRAVIPNQATLSAYLYEQILGALSLLHKSHSVDSVIRHMINEAEILIHRSLYEAALEKVNGAITLAFQYEKSFYELELIELKRKIRQRTDTLDHPQGELMKEWEREKKIHSINISRSAYRYYAYELFLLSRKEAVIRDSSSLDRYNDILKNEWFKEESLALSFQSKLDLYNSKAIYFRASGNFDKLYDVRKKTYDLLMDHPEIVKETSGIYLSSMNNLIIACFHKSDYDEGFRYITELKNYKAKNEDERRRLFVNVSSLELGYYDYTNRIEEGVQAALNVEEELNGLASKLSVHNRIALLFNLAMVYFKAGKNKNSARCLVGIINEKSDSRVEVRAFSRILLLIIYLEQNEVELLNSLLRSSVRFFDKTSRLFEFETAILEWINSVRKQTRFQTKDLIALKEKLELLKDLGKFKKTDDLIGLENWLESKLKR